MESLVFLLVMLGLIAFGTAVVFLRAREPKGEYRGIKSFQREMRALAPDGSRTMAVEGPDRPLGRDPLLPGTAGKVAPVDEVGPQPAERQE
jgi:hypothetical protein